MTPELCFLYPLNFPPIYFSQLINAGSVDYESYGLQTIRFILSIQPIFIFLKIISAHSKKIKEKSENPNSSQATDLP